ncbi:hypothetical protein JW935_19205 [candidate division KSB1 bacterium]|nr:hypothetical protein [candidate division KSB1 bacterium]
MPEPDIHTLMEELEQFRCEKEKIRKLVGTIGGAQAESRDKVINIMFIVFVVLLLLLDLFRHFFHIITFLPPLFAVELGVMMVSIKIIWMIHKSTKVEHFQFWILNSIEFRLNDVVKRLRVIEKKLEKTE